MKNIKINLKLYQYDELEQKAQLIAFRKHLEFLGNNIIGKGELDIKDEDVDTQFVEDNIRANEYWYFNNGGLADTITYTGKHSKKGITELKFLNEIYKL